MGDQRRQRTNIIKRNGFLPKRINKNPVRMYQTGEEYEAKQVRKQVLSDRRKWKDNFQAIYNKVIKYAWSYTKV